MTFEVEFETEVDVMGEGDVLVTVKAQWDDSEGKVCIMSISSELIEYDTDELSPRQLRRLEKRAEHLGLDAASYA